VLLLHAAAPCDRRAVANVCVFLSSSPGHRPEYRATAVALGQAIAAAGHTLVYGGSSVGLMLALADATMAAGGRVEGVIPRGLVDREVAHLGLTELVVVDNMHQRKAEMYRRADGFIVLPGGFGTLEEAFEILTGVQIGVHAKPIVFLDVLGFWTGLAGFLDHAAGEAMLRREVRSLFQLTDRVDHALAVATGPGQPFHLTV
jgi:uncharacterized protein (TIGR00730 family)